MVAAVAALLLFAGVTSVRAAETSSTVSGEATQQPVVSITISGRGSSDLTPLSYAGTNGEVVIDNTGLYVLNNGTLPIGALTLAWGSDPVVGTDVWSLGDVQGPRTAVWSFAVRHTTTWVDVPGSAGSPVALYGALPVGSRVRFDTRFGFPTEYSDRNAHVMTAMITAEP